MKPKVENMYHELFLWISSQGQWMLSDQVPLVRFSVLIILSLGKVELETIERRGITLRVRS